MDKQTRLLLTLQVLNNIKSDIINKTSKTIKPAKNKDEVNFDERASDFQLIAIGNLIKQIEDELIKYYESTIKLGIKKEIERHEK